MTKLDEMILSVTAQPKDDGKIRLKYLAISGGCGPDLTLDRDLAIKTIAALQSALSGEEFDSDKDYHDPNNIDDLPVL